MTVAVLLVRAGLGGQTHARPVTTPGGLPGAIASRSADRPVRKRFYVIRSGDTLGDVARRFDTTVERLLRLNPGVEPTSLRIGQKIRTA